MLGGEPIHQHCSMGNWYQGDLMKFTVSREALLKPLQNVAGVVERRHTLPILSNILLCIKNNQLKLTATDLEVELVAIVSLESVDEPGETTIPARKLFDICKTLSTENVLEIDVKEHKAIIKSSRSRFTLSTLPAADFPNLEEGLGTTEFLINTSKLQHLIVSTSFAMAQQDVRYYLNGMLLETRSGSLKAIATDGHRLAIREENCEIGGGNSTKQVIVPRKGILELSRLFEEDEEVTVSIGSHHIKVSGSVLTFTSKLVDGKFPDYTRVLPKMSENIMTCNREVLKLALSRTAILSNEKYRGIRLHFTKNKLTLYANNPEQEEAEEHVDVEYSGADLEVGFNVAYLIDVFSVLKEEQVSMSLADSNSSVLINGVNSDSKSAYVVMPMRL